MQQKIKLAVLAALAVAIIAGSVYLIGRNKSKDQVLQPSNSAQTEQTNQAIPEQKPEPANTDAKPDSIREISGKIRSINETAVYIELADGKGFAANINPSIPVITQGVQKIGTLVDLKAGQNVTVKVDSVNNAIEILIKK